MTDPNRTPLDYATPVSRPRASLPIPVAVAMLVCGTLLLLAPWICIGLGNASWASLIRSLHDWPFFWFTELLGFTMVLVAYLRAGEREHRS